MKIVLDTITSGYKAITKYVSNFTSVQEHLNDKVLYRDNPSGEPNDMQNDLPMNGNSITGVDKIYYQGGQIYSGGDETDRAFMVKGLKNLEHSSVSASYPINSVIENAGLYVAVGNDDTTDAEIYTSNDGRIWTEQSNPKAFDLNDVVYGSGLYVAVGDVDGTDAYIVTSPDGSTWTERANPKNFSLNSVAYNSGLYVAVGNADGTDAYIITSADGTSWTERANPKNFSLNQVAYIGSQWIAVGTADGTDAYILTSPDGTTWTEQANPKNFTLNSISSDGSKIIAVGNADGTDAYMITSTDGVTWTEVANPSNYTLHSVIYISSIDLWIASGAVGDSASAYLIYSIDDGVTWTSIYSGVASVMSSLKFINNGVVGVDQSGKMLRSWRV